MNIMRTWQRLLVLVIVLVIGLAGFVFSQVRGLEVEQITNDLYVIYGLGGNVAVLDTDEGTVIVDTMTLKYQGDRIKEEAMALTGKPVTLIINTHYHLDHIRGNPAFDAGTRIVSTKRTLHHLKETDSEYFSGEASQLMPNETFVSDKVISMGNKTLKLMYPGRGHTDGDLVVLFEEDKTLHTGDLFFYRHYPNIDLEGGGSVMEWGDTIDKILEVPFLTVIPGHGNITVRANLTQFQLFVRQLASIGKQAAENGTSLEETIATDKLTADEGYEPLKMIIGIGLTREFVLQRAWEEANVAFERRP
jgi:cyclase